MRTIMSRSPHDGSFSFSRRHFNFNLNNWLPKKHASGDARQGDGDSEWEDEGPIFPGPEPSDKPGRRVAPSSSSSASSPPGAAGAVSSSAKRRSSAVLSRLRSAFTAVLASSALRLLVTSRTRGLANGSRGRVTGTLFGLRRGRVHLSFQPDPRSPPLLLLELSTPTSSLVSEMASGLVRIALECDRKPVDDDGEEDDGGSGDHKGRGGTGADSVGSRPSRRNKGRRHLVDEPLWRAYCNGRKLGTAARRDPLECDLDVLRQVGPVTMGAGVVIRGAGGGGAGDGGGKGKGEQVMYMRAGFERVVGSADSMAFYMVGPEGGGGGAASGPELSIYLLRV